MEETRKLNILLVEDDSEEMRYCCGLVQEICPAANILKTGSSAEAMRLIAEHEVDLALLDVMLPDMSGFQLASQIRGIPRYAMLSIVFVTADAASELEAFRRFHCYHYITKPYTKQSFRETIEPLILALLAGHTHAPAEKERLLYLETGVSVHMLPLSVMLYAEHAVRKLIVHTTRGQISMPGHSLSAFIEEVDDPAFLQCHRAYAVNTNRVISIQKGYRRNWILTFDCSGETCPVSSTFYRAVSAALAERKG